MVRIVIALVLLFSALSLADTAIAADKISDLRDGDRWHVTINDRGPLFFSEFKGPLICRGYSVTPRMLIQCSQGAVEIAFYPACNDSRAFGVFYEQQEGTEQITALEAITINELTTFDAVLAVDSGEFAAQSILYDLTSLSPMLLEQRDACGF